MTSLRLLLLAGVLAAGCTQPPPPKTTIQPKLIYQEGDYYMRAGREDIFTSVPLDTTPVIRTEVCREGDHGWGMACTTTTQFKALKDTVMDIVATQTYIDCGKQSSGEAWAVKLLVILPDGKKVALDHCAAAQDSRYATEITGGKP